VRPQPQEAAAVVVGLLHLESMSCNSFGRYLHTDNT
jgi:hypothetical protein